MATAYRSELTKVAIHPSLVRSMTFMGGERRLVILAMLFSGYIAYLLSARYGVLWGLPTGGSVWAALLFVLRRMAIADPLMWAVLTRGMRYKAFYPARGRMNAFLPMIRDYK